MTPTPSRSTKANGLASLACTECRKQHLKCDAGRPSCARCVQGGTLCQYLPSRRGGRRRARDSPYHQSRSVPSALGDISSARYPTMGSVLQIHPNAQTHTPDNTPSERIGDSDLSSISTDQIPWPTMLPPSVSGSNYTEQPGRSWTDDDRLPRLYYENFHAAHPVLVPSTAYNDRNYPHFLQLVVNFVGSNYVPSSPSQEFKAQIAAELANSNDRSPCMVQACLIYSIALYARNEWPEAQDAFARSLELALELGMNRSDFALSAHPEQSVDAESMRRTWWELYVTDIYRAVTFKSNPIRCSAVSAEVSLPCEESIYNGGGDIPKPRMILDFRRRIFAADDDLFSSFSYRIEAAMILCRVLVLNRLRDCHRDHLQAVENALVSWINHLPPKKLDIVDCYGNVDEMMFQAHLTISYAAMLLHLPRSDLQPVLQEPDDRFWPGASAQFSSTFTRLVHSIKSTEASRRVSDLISVCPNVQKHTPFVIPALALCGMIQIATSKSHSEECFDHHCNRVTLVLGCLKSTKRTWSVAGTAYDCLRSSAAEVLSRSMDRWNAEPLNKLIPTEPAPNGPERPSSGGRTALRTMDGSEFMPPDLAPAFIDPTCYNASFFSPVPTFDLG
ncbi:Zn(II)2Cys6 transcription factor [Aspergillus candidus]|uniref:Zn(2)-C6 fungal-type domain-containing protein n=1 Tax=Aspergillus candidus TaxID=41067 RepID=A0A2I2FA83_ASPCN|nr:hypothetical protein BDW47DRAFT_132003 [Aspergillus candidus]PLB37535.1 hypothetical protein BDW47DRAFT_132003 [Aspergillus candidus]